MTTKRGEETSYPYECPKCGRTVRIHEKCVCGEYVGGEDYSARFMRGYDSIRSVELV